MQAVSHPVGLIERFSSIPGMPALLVYLVAAAVAVILLHKLGHALAASWRLRDPVHISLEGTGTLLSIRIRRLRLDVNALSHAAERPSSSSVAAVRASARDVVLVALAGPAASLLSSVIAACALSLAPGGGAVHGLLWAVTVMGLVGALPILPLVLQERPGGPRLRTDGRLALEAARVVGGLRNSSPAAPAPPESAQAMPATARTRAMAMGRGADTPAPRRSRDRRTGAPSGH